MLWVLKAWILCSHPGRDWTQNSHLQSASVMTVLIPGDIFKYWSHKKKPYGLCASVSELWYTGVWKCRVTNHDPHSCYLFLGKSGTYWLGQILLQFSLTRLLPRQTLVNPYMLSTKLQKLVGLDFWALLSMNSVPCHCTGRSRSYFNNHL